MAASRSRAEDAPPGLTRRPGTPEESAASLARSMETLEAAYATWDELRAGLAAELALLGDEKEQLEAQGSLMLGAVKVAGGLAGGAEPGLATQSPLSRFAADAAERLERSRAMLSAREAAARERFARAQDEVLALVQERLTRRVDTARPPVRLAVRALADERRVLHVERPSPEDAVVIQWVLSGRVPTRFGALSDDSTDDIRLAPQHLYPEEGVAPSAVRPGAIALAEYLARTPAVWPVKGLWAAFFEHPPEGLGPRLVRWIPRGQVLEVEVADGDGFRSLLTAAEAEWVAGNLVALDLAGRLALEFTRG